MGQIQLSLVLAQEAAQYQLHPALLDACLQVSALLADTAGRGVGVVLNTLTGPGFIEQSLAALAPQGIFLEISKRNVFTPAQMTEARPDLRYFLVDQAEILVQEPQLAQEQIQTLAELFVAGKLTPIPQISFALHDMVNAFRFMQQAAHTGKWVLIHPQPRAVALDAAATYLITGGLGGLCLVMARGLVQGGARRLLLISRRPPTAEAERHLAELRQMSATVLTAAVDVADEPAMAGLLAAIPPDYPLKGVIHAAGLLDDGLLVNQSWARFARVLAPKLDGAWNLHRLTAVLPLDFFILFSSASSLLGLAGQANYAAANAFLDGLAHYRQSLRLPALAINWGVWAEVGSAAQFVPQLKAMGLDAILPQQGSALLNALRGEAAAQIGVVPISWTRFDASRAFFAHMRRTRTGISVSAQEADESLLHMLQNKSRDAQGTLLKVRGQTIEPFAHPTRLVSGVGWVAASSQPNISRLSLGCQKDGNPTYAAVGRNRRKPHCAECWAIDIRRNTLRYCALRMRLTALRMRLTALPKADPVDQRVRCRRLKRSFTFDWYV